MGKRENVQKGKSEKQTAKMRNAKICRVQLQLHGFTVYVAAAPETEVQKE